MRGETPIRIRFDSAPQAFAAYREGLRLGVIAIPDPDGPPPGARVVVRLELPFARRTFHVEGEVTERSLAGTVIHLDLLPLGVHELLSVEEIEPALVPEESLDHSASEDSQSEMTDTGDPEASEAFSMDEDSEVALSRDDDVSVVDSADPDSHSTASMDTQDRYHRISDEAAAAEWPAPARGRPTPGEFDRTIVAGAPPEDDAGAGGAGAGDRTMLTWAGAGDGGRAIEAGVTPGQDDQTLLASTARAEPRRDATQVPPPGATVGGMPIPGDPTASLPAVARLVGTAEEAGWAPLLLTIMREELCGVLVVDSPSQRCWIYCQGGSPVHVVRAPARESDALGPILEGRALLDPEITERCRYLAQATGRSYLSVLMRLELLDEAALDELRVELVTRALLEVITEVSGPFRFFDLPELTGLFHHTPAAVMDALLRWALERNEAITAQQADELRRRHAGEHVFLTALGERLFRHVELRPEESRVLTRMLFDDQTIGEVTAHSRLGDRQLIRVVLALYQIGLVELAAAGPGEERQRLLAERELRSLSGRLRRDHFTLIGAHWTDPPDVLARALERTRAIATAVRPRPAERTSLARLREALVAALREAEEALLDADARGAYRRSLVDEAARRLAAQQAFRRGKIAARHGDLDAARRSFSLVIELDPGGAASGDRPARAQRALAALRAGG